MMPDMIWLTSTSSSGSGSGSSKSRKVARTKAIFIHILYDSLWSLNTKAKPTSKCKGKMRKTISNSVGIHQFSNCARVHSDAISIEDIFFFFRAYFLMGSLLPLEHSHPFWIVQAFCRIFVSFHSQAHDNSFPWYYILYLCVRERSTFCNVITYWLRTRDNRSFCLKSNGFFPCQM